MSEASQEISFAKAEQAFVERVERLRDESGRSMSWISRRLFGNVYTLPGLLKDKNNPGIKTLSRIEQEALASLEAELRVAE